MDPVCMPHSWITRFVYMQTEHNYPGPLPRVPVCRTREITYFLSCSHLCDFGCRTWDGAKSGREHATCPMGEIDLFTCDN